MKKLIFLFLVIQFSIAIENCICQWVQTSGPMGGNIYSFLYVNNKIIAGSSSNSFYSNDYGSSWTKISGLEGKWVRALIKNGINIYAGTTSGVYISGDNGINWNLSNTGMVNPRISSLANSTNYIFASSDMMGSGKVYRSLNNGINWEVSLNNVLTNTLLVSGANIFAGSGGAGIYLSTNEGNNWTTINEGLSNLIVYALTSIGSNIFAGTNGGVFKSTNNGANWILSNSGITNNSIRSLGASGSYIFAGTTSNIYLSTDNGTTWNEVMNGMSSSYFNSIFILGANSFTGSSSGIYLSTNNGALWTEKNIGITGMEINSLLYAGGYIFASTGNGVFRSSSNGDDCTKTGLGGADLFASINNTIFTSTSSGVFKTTNFGVNWIQISTNIIYAQSITASGNSLFVGTSNKGIWRTTNFGDTWDTVNTGIASHDITAMGSYNGVIYCGTWNEWWVYKSTNNGNSWINMGLEGHILDFAFDGNNVMVGRCDTIFRTSNGGINWFPVSYGVTMFCENTRLYQAGSNVFVSSCGNLFMTTNFGTNWILKTQGMENQPIRSFASSNDKVFAGTYNSSVWRRDLTEIIGINKISTNVPDKYLLYQNYPNPFNPSTVIKYQIKDSRFVTLKVYDILGKEVATLVNEKQTPGVYEVKFDGLGLSSGIYFYKLVTNNFSKTKKLILLK